MAPRIVAKQLAHPRGLLGRLIAHLMNRHNANMNAFAVRQLELTDADRVLEIGFGGGVTLPPLIERAGFVAGVDRSQAMVRRAEKLFAAAVRGGRALFREGQVEKLPFADRSFGKICTVNTVYFWHSLEAGLREIHRVLTPGGRLALGFLPKERMDRMNMPIDIFTPRAPAEVVEALRNAGFKSAEVTRPRPDTPWNVIVATR
jgi:SAM-dependent methyltransferase